MKNFKRILIVGEKDVFRELAAILELDIQASKIMSNMLSQGYSASMTDMKQEIKSLAKQSGEVAFKVSTDITSGAVSPNILDDLLESVNRANNILEQYYALSRELNRMLKVKVAKLDLDYDAEFKLVLGGLSDLSGRAIADAKALLTSPDLGSMMGIRKEILALKEQGDEVKNGGFDKLYGDSSKLSYVEFVYYAELLHRHEYILEACKDLSNLSVSIVNSIAK